MVSPPNMCYFLHLPILQSSVLSSGSQMMGPMIASISPDASFRGPPTPQVRHPDVPPLLSYSSSFLPSPCSPLFFPRTLSPVPVDLLYLFHICPLFCLPRCVSLYPVWYSFCFCAPRLIVWLWLSRNLTFTVPLTMDFSMGEPGRKCFRRGGAFR